MSIPVFAPSPMAVFDRDLLRRRRDRAADAIHEHDFLLRHVAAAMADRLADIRRPLPHIIELGAAGGTLTSLLRARAGTEKVTPCDLSPCMVEKNGGIVVDEEYLPFDPNSADAVVSNLSLHWVNDLPGTLAQIGRTLKPDGLFMASVLGGQTLKELRDSLMQAELAVTGGASPRVSPFIDLRDMGALLQRARFALPVVDGETVTVDYGHPLKLLHDLRGMGAANATMNRLMRPTRRAVMFEAMRIYQEKYGDAQGRVPATFEIIHAIGWKPHDSQQKPLKPGSAKARLADSLGTAETEIKE